MNPLSLLRRTGAITLSIVALLPFADARFEKNLPAETYGFIQAHNLKTTAEAWDAHPLKADVTKGQFEVFFAPIWKKVKEKMREDQEFWTDMEKLEKVKNAFTGEVTFAVVNTPKTEKGHAPLDLVFQAEVGISEEAIADLLKEVNFWQEKSADSEDEDGVVMKKIKESFQGVTLHCLEAQDEDEESVNCGGWALVDGKVFIFATAPNVLRELVDAEQNGRKGNFSEQNVWKREQEKIGKYDTLVFVNPTQAFSQLREFIKTMSEDADPNMLGVDPMVAYDSLGLDAIESFWMSGALEKDTILYKSSLGYTEKKGLLSLGTVKPLRQFVPELVPVDSANFGVMQWDMALAWKKLEDLIFGVAPHFKMLYEMQLNELKTKEGIDLKGALLDNLGDELVVLASKEPTVSKTMTGDALYVFSLKDPTKLESLLATVLGKEPSIRSRLLEREFMGVKINEVQIPNDDASMPPPVPFYTVWEGRLFIGFGADASLLEKVIAEKKSGGRAKGNAIVAHAVSLAPKDAYAFSYSELGSQLSLILLQLRMMEAESESSEIDWSKAPTAKDFPWSASGFSKETPHGQYSEYVLFRHSSVKE